MLTSRRFYPSPSLVDLFDLCGLRTAYAWAWWSDAIGLRWPPIVFAGVSPFRVFHFAAVLRVHPTSARYGVSS